MVAPNDTLWVAPQGGTEQRGTLEQPFDDIRKALKLVEPGQTIALLAGEYPGEVTVEVSGSREHPIRIIAAEPGSVHITRGCWFFYDVSDVIVEGLAFRDTTLGALCIMGTCERNSFSRLTFVDCGYGDDSSCTLFFGGSGNMCNVVEQCRFERSRPAKAAHSPLDKVAIALMVAQGDADGGAPNRNLLLRSNRFINYGVGVVLGSSDRGEELYGHVVEGNVFEGCGEGIVVRCGDSDIRNNLFNAIATNAINVLAGSSSLIQFNRMQNCKNGIHVCGDAHTISDNCIVNAAVKGVHVGGCLREGIAAAAGVYIERNTVVSTAPQQSAGSVAIRIDPGTSCIIQRNLVASTAPVYEFFEQLDSPDLTDEGIGAVRGVAHIVDNLAVEAAVVPEGFSHAEVAFAAAAALDFDNQSGYGATGWVLRALEAPPEEAFDESRALALEEAEERSEQERLKLLEEALFYEDRPSEDES
jgi:hypothetical protein